MFESVCQATICLIACHGGPADHFATFAQHLPSELVNVEIYASGPALKKFEDRGISVKKTFSLDNISQDEEDALAEQIAKACAAYSVVITDVGHSFDIKLQNALARHAIHVLRLAYYDNPEPYVPGGYSKVATTVMLAAQGVIFANSNLASASIFQVPGKEIDFGSLRKIGIGYYPLDQAEKIARRRADEQSSIRQLLFSRNSIIENNQKVLVYFGGNNDEYYSKAFPAFLSLLAEGMQHADFSNLVLVIHQHPGAKAKNLDVNMTSEWINEYGKMKNAPKIIVSNFSTDDAQVVADAALYYQTSMGPQFVLAGIPTVQIGHETFQDILVKNHLSPSVTHVNQLVDVIGDLDHPKKEIQQAVILDSLGIRKNWLQIFKNAIGVNSTSIPQDGVVSGLQAKKINWRHFLSGSIIAISLLAIRFFKNIYTKFCKYLKIN
ncbi:MAG: hypothetical protein H0X29_07565 [Parachlamydiaceae bacterium]|nr:hypothetical protein [Parachlamydiaceae bacterium]